MRILEVEMLRAGGKMLFLSGGGGGGGGEYFNIMRRGCGLSAVDFLEVRDWKEV